MIKAYIILLLTALVGQISASFDQLFRQVDDYSPWGYMKDWKQNIDLNKQPVIGILSQTLETYMKPDPRFANYTSYMMTAYVKYVQG